MCIKVNQSLTPINSIASYATMSIMSLSKHKVQLKKLRRYSYKNRKLQEIDQCDLINVIIHWFLDMLITSYTYFYKNNLYQNFWHGNYIIVRHQTHGVYGI